MDIINYLSSRIDFLPGENRQIVYFSDPHGYDQTKGVTLQEYKLNGFFSILAEERISESYILRNFQDFWTDKCLRKIVNPSNYEDGFFKTNYLFSRSREQIFLDDAYSLYKNTDTKPNVLVTNSLFYKFEGLRQLRECGFVDKIERTAYLNPDKKQDEGILFFIKNEERSFSYNCYSSPEYLFETHALDMGYKKTGIFGREFFLHENPNFYIGKCNLGIMYYWNK